MYSDIRFSVPRCLKIRGPNSHSHYFNYRTIDPRKLWIIFGKRPVSTQATIAVIARHNITRTQKHAQARAHARERAPERTPGHLIARGGRRQRDWWARWPPFFSISNGTVSSSMVLRSKPSAKWNSALEIARPKHRQLNASCDIANRNMPPM